MVADMEIFSCIASGATLILFIIYFIGRYMTIKKTKSIFLDEVAIELSETSKDGYNIVETFKLENNPYNSFILTSREGIYSLTVFKLLKDKKWNTIGRTEIHKYDFLNIGQSLEFLFNDIDVGPNYEIEYYTPDYKKVTISLWSNLKNGVVSESAFPKHTWKSYLYYLFR